ncbi:hypothetical protein [Paenibacillus durus]|uniref:Uncharacterized protein n=1 Tax=Paenibacillus durus TaxID=44251 RepID=A0A089HQW3_PAEDU|nr:hypothetical protein [Paenibacillus durus]AIQ13135.1 hypothetical protein PDUR_15340 [Paenibacillus durus]
MGTKFANIHVRYLEPAQVIEHMPGCSVRVLSEGWTTVLREDFQMGQIEQIARGLSKKIENVVLSVGYFDDDVLALHLFHKGKMVTSDITNNAYGYQAKRGNPTRFQQSLELDQEVAPLLKEVFKCDDLEEKVYLLEHLLGVHLWISYDANEIPENELRLKQFDRSIVNAYCEDLKAKNKIKNKTKLQLITEFEGMPVLKTADSTDVQLPRKDGSYLVDDSNVYELLSDGSLMPRLQATNEENRHILLNFPDGSTLYSTYCQKQVLFECNAANEKIWEFEVGYLKVNPALHQNKLFFHIQKADELPMVVKINRQGQIESSLVLDTRGGCHWEKFLFDSEGRIYHCCTQEKDGIQQTHLYCLSEQLEILDQIEIDDTSFNSIIDRHSQIIYLHIFEGELFKIELQPLHVSTSKKCYGFIRFLHVDQNGNVYIQTGSSTFEVWNSNLELISRHKLKGQIFKVLVNEQGRACFATWNGTQWDSGKEQSKVRLYEVG